MTIFTALLVVLIFLLVILPFTGSLLSRSLLLVTSFLFYFVMTDISVALMLLLVILINLGFNLLLKRNQNRYLLFFFIALNVVFLGLFKYSDQIINGIFSYDALPEISNSLTYLIIFPLGISYYTLKNISHLVEVYKGKIKKFSSLDFANYLLFFPQIISGPIAKPKEFYRAIRGKEKQDHNNSFLLYKFLSGVVKLFFFSILLFPIVDGPFDFPSNYTQIQLVIALFAYTLYIYVNFSGYSEVSNLMTNLIGFKETPNFDTPYLSGGVTEFWRRWHISLSTWLKDYIYIPLGGNRKGAVRTYFNLFVTLLISGIWHGATLNFVAWGGLHGIWLAIERALKGKSKLKGKVISIVAIGLTFLGVTLLWVVFAAADINIAMEYYKILFGFGNSSFELSTLNLQYVGIVLLGVLFIFTERLLKKGILSLRIGFIAGIIIVVTAIIIMYTPGTVPEFIYGGF